MTTRISPNTEKVKQGKVNKTHHSKAAKTSPAMLVRQVLNCRPKLDPHSASPRRSERAMKPANQKIMVTASTPRMANLCANWGNLAGARRR